MKKIGTEILSLPYKLHEYDIFKYQEKEWTYAVGITIEYLTNNIFKEKKKFKLCTDQNSICVQVG